MTGGRSGRRDREPHAVSTSTATIALTFVLGRSHGRRRRLPLWPPVRGHLHNGLRPGPEGVTAAVLGGIGNIRGAMIGGLLLGVFESIPLRWMSA